MSAALDLVGQTMPLRVRLDRGIDHRKPCCDNVAIIRPGRGPHAAELRCESCGAHRGWLRAKALTFIETLARQFSAPVEPLILRDTTIGDHQMTTEKKFEQKPNSGALFKNTQRHSETDAEYTGSLNVEGREFWLNAWVNEAKSGQKYFRLLLKPKAASPGDTRSKSSPAADFNDSMPF